MKCTAQMAHKPVQTSSATQTQVLRSYCPNIYVNILRICHCAPSVYIYSSVPFTLNNWHTELIRL